MARWEELPKYEREYLAGLRGRLLRSSSHPLWRQYGITGHDPFGGPSSLGVVYKIRRVSIFEPNFEEHADAYKVSHATRHGLTRIQIILSFFDNSAVCQFSQFRRTGQFTSGDASNCALAAADAAQDNKE